MRIRSAQNLVCSRHRFLGFGLLMGKNFIQRSDTGTVHRRLFSWLMLRWISRRSLAVGPPVWGQVAQLLGCMDSHVKSLHLSPAAQPARGRKVKWLLLPDVQEYLSFICFFPLVWPKAGATCVQILSQPLCSLRSLSPFQPPSIITGFSCLTQWKQSTPGDSCALWNPLYVHWETGAGIVVLSWRCHLDKMMGLGCWWCGSVPPVAFPAAVTSSICNLYPEDLVLGGKGHCGCVVYLFSDPSVFSWFVCRFVLPFFFFFPWKSFLVLEIVLLG